MNGREILGSGCAGDSCQLYSQGAGGGDNCCTGYRCDGSGPDGTTGKCVQDDWQVYRNEEHGFMFRYPSEREPGNKFEIVEKEGAQSIYGWPDSTIVLLGCDYCQSYEIIVQSWRNREEFESNCSGAWCEVDLENEINDRYITVIINNNKFEIFHQILSTFEFVE